MTVRRAATLVVVGALGIAGCGGSSSKTSTPQPLSKAAYEHRLGPLLNQQVAPAIRAALANGGLASPQRLSIAIANIKIAHDRMAAVTPPAAIAVVHKQAVDALGAVLADMEKLHAAELSKDRPAALAALNGIKTHARQIVNLGTAFSSRGY